MKSEKNNMIEGLKEFYNSIPDKARNDYEITFYVGASFLNDNKDCNQNNILSTLFNLK